MKHLEINSVKEGGVVWIDISKIAVLEDKWEGQLNAFAARIDGVAVLEGGVWFWSWIECMDFA